MTELSESSMIDSVKENTSMNATLLTILRIVVAIAKKLNCPIVLAKRFEYGVGPVTTKKAKQKMLELTITNEQKVNVQLHPVTQGGHPAPVDGVPVWEVVSGNATVEPASDGMSADLISPDDPGDTVFMVSADADLGSGTETISDTITLHTQHANAAALGLTASDPVPK